MKKLLPALLTLAALSISGQAVSAPTQEQQVDALFARWSRPDTPGCEVEIIRDGRIVFQKGYGMADIEHNVPVSPDSVFNIGSASKQFTAFAIHLLARDGKLSLDDDARKYVPELPDFGTVITIRHLLQHTSGLRDYLNVLLLSGWRLSDQITADDALGVIGRQRTLNFAPGQEHVYSNSGYFLAGLIVQRVSGQPLGVFAKERIFDPLGMTHTTFREGYGGLVKDRAMPYDPAPGGGYEYVASLNASVGASGVLTTVGDLALWDRNFYDGKVGGLALIADMQKTGVLNDGKAISYASGLFVESYRGLTLVEHSGGLPGFAAQFSRFPAQRFSVAVLANTSEINPSVMARRIADIYLDRELAPAAAPAAPPAPALTEAAVDPARLDALLGYYALSPAFGLTVTREDGRLAIQGTGQPRVTMSSAGERVFFYRAENIQLTFDAPGPDGVSPRVVLRQRGQDVPGIRGDKPVLSRDGARAYEGDFYSDELRVLYTVAFRDGKLMLTYPRGTMELAYAGNDKFLADRPIGAITYQCGRPAACTGLAASNTRARDVRFRKVTLAPPAPLLP